MSDTTKSFKLPKEFAEKWIKALESGEYKQGSDTLVGMAPDGKSEYCCLGVAGKICGASDEDMRGSNYLEKGEVYCIKSGIPKELLSSVGVEFKQNELSDILSQMNDGLDKPNYEGFMQHYPNLKFPVDMKSRGIYHFSFKEIAQFIRDNIELV